MQQATYTVPTLPKQLALKKHYKHITFEQPTAAFGAQLRAGDAIAWCNERMQPLCAPVCGTLTHQDEHYYHFVPAQHNETRRVFVPLTQDQWNDTKQVLERIRQAGILGMGGGCFPTAKKLALDAQALIINAVECEPGVQNDAHLLANHAQEIATAIDILRTAFAYTHLYFARKKNQSVAKVITKCNIEMLYAENAYPSGSEQNLKQKIIESHSAQIAASDIVCVNLATLFAVYRAVVDGQVSNMRLVTIHTQDAPAIVAWAYFGTSYAALLAQHKIRLQENQQLIANGLMMGQVVDNPTTHTVDAGTLALFVREDKSAQEVLDCIQCNRCSDACPAGLWPQTIYAAFKHDKLSSELSACILCGICDFVCPSHIPLVDAFRVGKTVYNNEHTKQNRAAAAKQRYENKLQRSSRAKKHIAAARLRARADLYTKKTQDATTTTPATQRSPSYQRAQLQALLAQAKKENADAQVIKRIEAQLATMTRKSH